MLKVDISSFSYGATEILSDIHFKLDKGQHMAVLGESGCGKSTLLHLIYGLLHLEEGSIFWQNNELKGPKFNLVPGEDFIKLVAQEFNVMPFTTVAENIAEHLGRIDQVKDAARVNELLTVVDMESFSETMVKNLSGGQKQRVALAKALANAPELLLLDEPFSHIDTFRKNKLRRRLYSYLKENHIACITATHDSEEALAFSDKIMILKNGRCDAIGTPEAIYNHANTEYQAGFFDEVNKLPASFFPESSKVKELLLYPHQLMIRDEVSRVEARVEKCYFKGSRYLVHATSQGLDLFIYHPQRLRKGALVYVHNE
jgi:ABC-type sulfate/molybdate transport systems ATPase subunit